MLVVGAGIMGAGIAQVAAQAGHTVRLFDAREGAAAAACAKLEQALEGLVAKGKLDAEQAKAAVARIRAVDRLDDAAGAGLVVEAIIENADAKRALFRELEAKVDARCVLASNTSSISVTALANGLKAPGRFVGMHFFNPVPLMKLVEVVSGLETDPAVAQAIFELEPALGQDAGACALDAGLHRQPHRPPVLRRDPGAAARACRRAGGARRLPARRRLSHGAVRADGPDRPRHQLRGDRIGVRRQLLRQALHAFAGAARDGRRRPARPQVRPRLLRLSGAAPRARRPRSSRRRFRPARSSPCTAAASPSTAGRRGSARPASRSSPIRASRWNGLQTAHGELRLTDGRPAAQVAAEEGVRDLALFDLATARNGGAPGVALAYSVSAGATPPGARRPAAGCASPAGRRSRSATRPAWWSRAPSRC